MSLRTVHVDRYVTPLREGGSLPAIVEGDDQGLYVLKFRGAGQGKKVLIAELVAGGLARVAGLPVPEIVFAELDIDLAKAEPDPEIQSLIQASGGLNIAMDYLPGAITFDPLTQTVESALASRIVWMDAFISNVDRTFRNSNMLMWHKKLWLIDHGASLIFQYDWAHVGAKAKSPFALIKNHVLLKFAGDLENADREMRTRITEADIKSIVAKIPDSWLEGETAFSTNSEHRQAYETYLIERLGSSRLFVEEALRARSALV